MKLNKHLFFGFFIYIFIFSFFLFLLNISDSKNYIFYGMTSGSDDHKYFLESVSALKSNFQSFEDILNYIKIYSGHAVAYPLILYSVFCVFGADVNVALILNAVVLYFCFVFLYKYIGGVENLNNNIFLLILMLTPGAYYVALHMYKDTFLFFVTLISIFFLERGRAVLGGWFAMISHFLRPYNFLIILLLKIIRKYPLLIICLFFIGISIFLKNSYLNDKILSSIDELNKIALDDLQSYGSNYTPSGIIFLDYLVGIIRFFFLPFPFKFNWNSNERPVVLLFLEFYQSILNYIAFIFVLLKFDIFIKTVKKYYLLFGYTFFQASVYSVIFFGNSQPRYRIYFFSCVTIFLLEVLGAYLNRKE